MHVEEEIRTTIDVIIYNSVCDVAKALRIVTVQSYCE